MAGKCPCCGAHIKVDKCEYCGYVEKKPEPPVKKEVIYKHIYVNEPEPPKVIVKEVVKEVKYTPETSEKSRLVALLLCLFLGWIGGHRFYVGKIGTGVFYLFSGGFWGIGVFFDFIAILSGNFKDKEGLALSKWQ
ncbi:MAG: TM2 domain-containing protein [Christensenellaceae bacterium]|nr:TM2 domain-containing protein [Christensenellaceae bacterium]